MSEARKRLHSERVEAYEVKLDLLVPGQCPVLVLHHRGEDPRRAVVSIPNLERHKLYLGRLVDVEDHSGERRKASVEAVDGCFALVRYVDWND